MTRTLVLGLIVGSRGQRRGQSNRLIAAAVSGKAAHCAHADFRISRRNHRVDADMGFPLRMGNMSGLPPPSVRDASKISRRHTAATRTLPGTAIEVAANLPQVISDLIG